MGGAFNEFFVCLQWSFFDFSTTSGMLGVVYISKNRSLGDLSFDIELNYKYQLSTKNLTNTIDSTLNGTSKGVSDVKNCLQWHAVEG